MGDDLVILSISLTDAGAERAALLPHRHIRGDLAATVRAHWDEVDGFVLFCATGIAVRVIAPLLGAKDTDPAVVCVDEAGRFAVALCGGHGGGANDLARSVAELLGAEAVVTTATDTTGVVALDDIPRCTARGDIAGVARAMLDGEAPAVVRELDWPVPLDGSPNGTAGTVLVTDRAVEPRSGTVVLCPHDLVVGVGASTGAPAGAAAELLAAALADAGLHPDAIGLVATIDRRADDPVVTSLGHPIRAFDADALAGVEVPNPSDVVRSEVGTASVAEAAALLAAGPDATLVVEKRKGAEATVAIARRARPEGSLAVVGLGPGHARHRTPQATAAIRDADTVIGYDVYVDQCTALLSPAQEVVRSPIGAEADRCAEALKRAAAGQRVALVCSGDPGVFAMATLVLELAPAHGSPPVTIVPGVTAGLAASALLGAPLGHDHALISLSDLMTPWEAIEQRLEAAAAADLVTVLYNPRSRRRTRQLEIAREIFAGHRPASTPVAVVTDATRPGERTWVGPLSEFDPTTVDMFSLVVVGSSATRIIGGRMVTPRGYEP
ncbi:MAG: precorrin-3B C(17)-methyltransferase [Actinomycetota bacterium]|nr:precorrin-3B C(17)-methyltransferase [Actinomycetota bacterium]